MVELRDEIEKWVDKCCILGGREVSADLFGSFRIFLNDGLQHRLRYWGRRGFAIELQDRGYCTLGRFMVAGKLYRAMIGLSLTAEAREALQDAPDVMSTPVQPVPLVERLETRLAHLRTSRRPDAMRIQAVEVALAKARASVGDQPPEVSNS